ncbi:beta-lactamase/transpeptidase-like protein [Trichoderma sp. SZMC 28014]
MCHGQHTMFIKSRLEALGPLITQICDITGIPGISLGVLHHGETLHTASYGFQDVERQVEPNADTSFLICSMTKAITASLIGMVIDEGKLNFSTQLHQIIPEFQRNDAQANITIEDLLSHRTGLAPYDGLWLGSDNQILMNRSEAIPILNYTPAASALRTEFIYNNIAYEALGQVLERSTGLAYSELLHKRIIEPLNLHRTFYAEEPLDNNTAKSYTTLKDVAQSSVSEARNVFKQMPQLLKGKIGIPNQSLREYSYASGWIRAQLPAIVDLFADYEPPLLGSGSASRLMIHHQGHVAGNVGYAALFPETTSAVVVLGNSAGLTDAMRLLGQVIVETVLGNEVDEKLYLDTAIAATKNTIASMDKIYEDLLAGKIIDQPMRNIAAYIGRYYNAIDNFFIDIIEADGKLRVAYMGSTANTFDLTPYEADSFFWWLDFDESAKRARLPGYPKDYFILKFGCPSTSSWLNRDVEMGCLTWKHEFQLAGPGEVFRKKTRESHIDISGIFGILKELR